MENVGTDTMHATGETRGHVGSTRQCRTTLNSEQERMDMIGKRKSNAKLALLVMFNLAAANYGESRVVV